jgi:hypothetical protein
MTHSKLIHQLERDIRNQVLIDSLKRLNRKQRTMVYFRRHALPIAATTLSFLWIMFCITMARAEDAPPAPKFPCPTTEPCKILTLTPQEEKLLIGQNGILDTAAQGRQIDLGGFAVYFKSKIATATAGETKPPEKHDAPAVPGEAQRSGVDNTPK